MKIKYLKVLLILIVFYASLQLFLKYYQIGINQSKSVKGTVFLLNKDVKNIDNYEYVVLLYDADDYMNYTKGKKFIKKIICKSGDNLDFLETKNNYEYFCNNILIAQAFKRDSKNNPLPHFNFKGTIPKDKYFVIGTHPKSFDSRYWGFVDREKIIAGATKLW